MKNMKKIIKYGFIFGYVILIVILVVEAGMPGAKSASQSDSVGNVIGGIFDDLTKENNQYIQPEELQLLTNQFDFYVGESVKIETKIMPIESSYQSIVYSTTNYNVATVTTSGVVKFKKAGVVTINLIIDGTTITNKITFRVKDINAKALIINDIDEDIYISKVVHLSTTITPTNATKQKVYWKSLNEDIASINSNGVLRAQSDGIVTIVAYTSSGLEASKIFHIKKLPIVEIKEIIINNPLSTISIGDSYQLRAQTLPSDSTYRNIKWTIVSGSEFAQIYGNGLLIPSAEGLVTIRAYNDHSKYIYKDFIIRIEKQPEAEDYQLNFNKIEIVCKTTKQIVINNIIPNKGIINSVYFKSLNNDIATVDSQGLIRGLKEGITKIEVNINNIIKYIDIEVIDDQIVNVESINILEYPKTVCVGDCFEIKSSLAPFNATDQGVSYEIDNPKIINYVNGYFIAYQVGKVRIKIVSNQNQTIYKYIDIEIKELSISEINIKDQNNKNITSLDLMVGQSIYLNIIIKHQTKDDDLINPPLQVQISNPDGIEAYANGEIHAFKVGNYTIKYYDSKNPNVYKTLKVKVSNNEINNIKIVNKDLKNGSLKMAINQNVHLDAIISPLNVTYHNIIWSSSNPQVAIIDNNGLIIPKMVGTVTIKATSSINSQIYDSITIIVVDKYPTYINITNKEVKDQTIKIMAGKTFKMQFQVDNDVTFDGYQFQSSNPEIAVIGKDGVIRAIKSGTTDILIFCENDNGDVISTTIFLEVYRQPYVNKFDNFKMLIRKGLGHFGSFCILAIICFGFFNIIFKNRQYLVLPVSLINGFIIAGLTELIQLFTPGRSGLWSDVWIDFKGYLTGSVICLIILIIIKVYKWKPIKKDFKDPATIKINHELNKLQSFDIYK